MVTTAAPSRPETRPVVTADGVEIRLTRHPGGGKGPVLLAPGYGNAARAFTLGGAPRSFVQYLDDHGYDVWLLDYRASPEVEASHGQFSVDAIAREDWPAAVDAVREETGAESVQAIAHCVGSMSLFMALGAGMEGVRSAVCSQLGGHPVPTPGNRARARLRMATALKKLGIDALATDFDARSPVDRGLDVAMRALPTGRRCDSPVCRRIAFIYGDVLDHDRLDEKAHSELEGFFGGGNMTFFEHISAMIRAARVMDDEGRDVYLRPENLELPIAFLHGEHNRMFLPQSTQRTYDWLQEANDPSLYRRHVIGGYAHLDCWLGTRADRDVFPIALAELERHPA